ncbi:hypothetical protein P4O66_015933 [Electrophorus voltai]|uniref:Uncharacterized protein n=1 Tax=Electrophorus voltai TaxID=2609070 RepID=A0AAD9DP71_9TELE|nr:hypothetical protein P4O66_015933 [Electrophorus voltai]
MNMKLQPPCTRKHKTNSPAVLSAHPIPDRSGATSKGDLVVPQTCPWLQWTRGGARPPRFQTCYLLPGPPLSRCSRSVPETACLRGFGQTPPASLASLLKGRHPGFHSTHRRSRCSTQPPSFWSVWCPLVLLGPGSTALGPPPPRSSWGCSPLLPEKTRTAVAVLYPMSWDPGSSAGGAYVSLFFAAGAAVLWWLIIP